MTPEMVTVMTSFLFIIRTRHNAITRRNFKIIRLGRVPGGQEFILVAIKRKTVNEKYLFEETMKIWNGIGQMLVSGALDDTKTIGKVGADIFAKSGPEKPPKNRKKIQIFSGIFPVFPVDLAKNP